MTSFEILSTIVLWVIVGVWVCYKRGWYKHHNTTRGTDNNVMSCAFAIAFAPINLIWNFLYVFVIQGWLE